MAAVGVEMELVRIPGGAFMMGSDPALDSVAAEDEQPKHSLTLPEYWIGKTEVTNAQFNAFVKATSYVWSHGVIPASRQNYPVANVSWDDCMAFCAWLRTLTGQAFKLPTEAQWEKAARGTDGRIYPWGNDPPDDDRANFGQSVKDATEVGKYGSKGASPFGLDDVAGNVGEWTLTAYAEKAYPYNPADGRESETAQVETRVVRGGTWEDSDYSLRCAVRSFSVPSNRDDRYGFRVCMLPSGAL